jgi:uncharacterized protein YjiS (DUF1127 family)
MGAMRKRVLSNRFGRLSSFHNKTIQTGQEKDQESKTMKITRSFNEWRRYRATCNELSRLSTRELNDLGINRGDIPFVARKASRA